MVTQLEIEIFADRIASQHLHIYASRRSCAELAKQFKTLVTRVATEGLETSVCVWDWLGTTEEDFRKKAQEQKGFCVKCGKPAAHSHTLCTTHKRAYHIWRKKGDSEK